MDTTIKVTFSGEEAQEVLRQLLQSEASEPAPETTIEKPEASDRGCKICGTTETPRWRYTKADFGPLCNACGIRRMRGRPTKGHVRITGEQKTRFKYNILTR